MNMGGLDAAELNSLLEHFHITKKKYELQAINNGYINDTYLVLDNMAPIYIFQRINPSVFQDVIGLMGNVEKALAYLVGDGYSPIELVKTRTGKAFFEQGEEGFWRLMTFIDQSLTYNTTTNPEIAFEAGRIIGKFHTLLQQADVTEFVDTISNFHNLQLRQEQFEQAQLHAEKDKLNTATAAVDFAKDTFPKLASLKNAKLPPRVCHNDTKLNNILFSKKETKSLCLIDLDTIMKGYFYFDFGDAVRTIVNTAKEDERELHKITFEKELFRAFVNGLAVNSSFLTDQEKKSLHLGVVLMPFLHGLRALTDYLENDKYYKVSYKGQNLDRCLSLFQFTKMALQNLDYMQDVIQEKLMLNS